MPGLAQAFGQNPSVKKDLMLSENNRELKKSGSDKKRSHENDAASQCKVGQGWRQAYGNQSKKTS